MLLVRFQHALRQPQRRALADGGLVRPAAVHDFEAELVVLGGRQSELQEVVVVRRRREREAVARDARTPALHGRAVHFRVHAELRREIRRRRELPRRSQRHDHQDRKLLALRRRRRRRLRRKMRLGADVSSRQSPQVGGRGRRQHGVEPQLLRVHGHRGARVQSFSRSLLGRLDSCQIIPGGRRRRRQRRNRHLREAPGKQAEFVVGKLRRMHVELAGARHAAGFEEVVVGFVVAGLEDAAAHVRAEHFAHSDVLGRDDPLSEPQPPRPLSSARIAADRGRHHGPQPSRGVHRRSVRAFQLVRPRVFRVVAERRLPRRHDIAVPRPVHAARRFLPRFVGPGQPVDCVQKNGDCLRTHVAADARTLHRQRVKRRDPRRKQRRIARVPPVVRDGRHFANRRGHAVQRGRGVERHRSQLQHSTVSHAALVALRRRRLLHHHRLRPVRRRLTFRGAS
mmetsp:Transcript_2312/g.6916  ORF Transcript_2312/g.6916 Transcript_2312/m.6916 type:complete len:453 (-) Transcript_2312:33-1391(-)